VADRDSGRDTRGAELYARARAARAQAQAARAGLSASRADFVALREQITAVRQHAELITRLWLAPGSGDRLQYSAHARLLARLASLPVIEQAKGIIMAQCGWPAEQAFDALVQASQHGNIKVRDLAARIVAVTAGPTPVPAPQARSDRGEPAAQVRTLPVGRPAHLRPATSPGRRRQPMG
jgi:hypothetical protein